MFYNSLNLNEPINTVRVARIVMHPAFTRSSLNYDLAILQLEHQFEQGQNSAVIELANDEAMNDSEMIVTGWGKVDASGPISNQLLKAELKKLDTKTCEQQWIAELPITEAMFCGHNHPQSCCNVSLM